MKEIPLTQGFVALVDDADYEHLSQWKWYAARITRTNPAIAVRSETRPKQKRRRRVFMHRLIMNTPPGLVTDHLNHQTLDNRRENLRVCTQKENGTNHTKQQGTSSKYLGVHWHTGCSKWQARIQLDGKQKHLGYFDNEEEAARAYDAAVIEHRDEYATTNFAREQYHEQH